MFLLPTAGSRSFLPALPSLDMYSLKQVSCTFFPWGTQLVMPSVACAAGVGFPCGQLGKHSGPTSPGEMSCSQEQDSFPAFGHGWRLKLVVSGTPSQTALPSLWVLVQTLGICPPCPGLRITSVVLCSSHISSPKIGEVRLEGKWHIGMWLDS